VTTELATLTWPETAGDSRLLVVPVGSLEQHGPHLPLDTDTRIAVAAARALAQRHPEVVVAPPVPYGASGEHQSFPGTVSVGHDALAFFLLELVRSAAVTYRRILLVNGHGGNTEALRRIAERARYEGRDVRVWAAQVPGGDLHAGRAETSLLLALHPATVRMHRAEAGAIAPAEEIWPRMRAGGVRQVSPNGVLGDPTGASAEEGRALHTGLVDRLEAFISGWRP
jgi:mycofactocin system creatininase family protein